MRYLTVLILGLSLAGCSIASDTPQLEQGQHLSATDYLELRYADTPVTLVDRPETAYTLYSLLLGDKSRVLDRVFILNDGLFPKTFELSGETYTINSVTIEDATSGPEPSFKTRVSVNDITMVFSVVERERHSNDQYINNNTPCDDYQCQSVGGMIIEPFIQLELTEQEQDPYRGYIGLTRWKSVRLTGGDFNLATHEWHYLELSLDESYEYNVPPQNY